MYVAGANVYNGPVYFSGSSSGSIYSGYTSSGTTYYNNNIHLSLTGSGNIYLCSASGTTYKSELASGKTISISSFTAGTINLGRLKMIGSGTLSLSGGTGAKFIIDAYSEINRSLNLTAGRIETLNTTFNADATFTTTGSSSSLYSGGNTFNGNCTIENQGSGSFTMGYYTGGDKYYGNLTATQSSTGLIYLAYANYTNELKGNLTLTQNSSSPIGNGGGTLTFNGTSNQTITKSGSVNPEFGKLTVNKASGSVIQTSEVKINTTLTLTSGKLQTGSNTLHLGNGGTMSGASSSSFVEGTFKKTGNQAFTFPVGKSGVYAPLTITAPSSSSDVFTAEYVDGSPNGTYPLSQKDTSLHELDDTGYWLMSRPTGSSAPTVTVNFGIRCGTTSASTLIFAQWDATTSKWKDKGNGANTSTTLTHTGSIGWATGLKPIIVGRLTRLKVNAGSDVAYCYGSSTGLSASVTNGTSAFSYAWTPTTELSSSTVYNPTVSAASSGSYVVTVTDSRGCVARDTVGVTVNALPTVNAGSDTTIYYGDTVQIGTTAFSGRTYSWSPSTGLSSATVAQPLAHTTNSTVYALTVTNTTTGCVSRDTVRVGVVMPTSCILQHSEGNLRTSCACGGLGITSNSQVDASSVDYYHLNWYIPNLTNDFTPIKTIGINLYIVQKDDGTGNFQNTSEHLGYFHDLFADEIESINQYGDPAYFSINKMYSHNFPPTVQIALPSQEIPDSKIRYRLENVYFLPVNSTLFSNDYNNDTNGLRPTLFNIARNESGNEWNKNINYFFVETSLGGAFGFCKFPECNINFENYGFTTSLYSRFIDPTKSYDDNLWDATRHLSHEFGHSLDLRHPYDDCLGEDTPSCFDYLGDLYGTDVNGVNHPCPHIGHSDNNWMNGAYSNMNYTPTQVGKMHRTLSLGSTRKYVKDCPYSTLPIEITKDETWEMDIRVYNDIVVKAGNTLTVMCRIEFPDDAKLIVEQGAKLILDGGLLTSSCSVWKGIEVWGNPNELQSTNYQGKIEMRNGAIVENAGRGVLLGTGSDCCSKNGGIIVADNSTFRNNRTDVSFMQYKYNSVSSFTKTKFLTTQPMNGSDYIIDGVAYGTQQHVTIWDMRRISFTDCEFANEIDYTFNGASGSFAPGNRGIGIGTCDASFTVTSTDNTDPATTTLFRGLTQGVYSSHTITGMRRADVSKSLFNNTIQSVTLDGSSFDRFTENTFYVPPQNGWVTQIKPYGIYTNEAKNFTADGNIFYKYANYVYAPSYGMINKGGIENVGGGLAKNNVFEGVYIASQAEQNNPTLQWKCNTYTSNDIDWSVNPQSQDANFADQGTGCATNMTRAGNTFDAQANNIKSWAAPWRYYARGDAGGGPYTFPIFTTPVDNGYAQDCNITGTDNSCSSTGGGGGGWPPRSQYKYLLDADMVALRSELNTVKANPNNGQTDSLLARSARNSYTATALTTDLLSNSLLSDEVLKQALWRSPNLNENQVMRVVLHNSPVSGDVWKSRVAPRLDSMKQETADSIFNAQFTDTLRTVSLVERELKHDIMEWTQAIFDIAAHYADADSIPYMISYLADSTGADKSFRKMAVMAAIEYDSLGWARSLLDSVMLENGNDTAFYQFTDIALDLREDSLSWFGMDSVQKVKIEELALTNYEVKVNAEAVLALINDTLFERTPEPLPDSGYFKLAPPVLANEQQTAKKDMFKAYPNPFDGTFTLAYNLDSEMSNVSVELFDIAGKQQWETSLNSIKTGESLFSLPDCNGFYILRINNEKNIMYQTKLICIRH